MRIGAYTYPTYGGVDFRRVVDGLEACAKTYAADILIAPEYTSIPLDEQCELSTAFPSVMFLAGTTHVLDDDKIRNRVHVLKNGELLHIYDKRRLPENEHYALSMPWECENRNLEDRFFDMKTRFVGQNVSPGTQPHSFVHEGITYGIEICMDHIEQSYRSEMRSGNEPSCDYQLVIACGAQYISDCALALKRSGLCVLVDGYACCDPGKGFATARTMSRDLEKRRLPIGRSPKGADELVVFSDNTCNV